MLLGIEHGAGDVFGNVVVNVIADDEGHGLALADVDASYHALSKHVGVLNLLEADDGPATLAVLAVVNADIKLELDVLAVKRSSLALSTARDALLLEDSGSVRFRGILEGRKDLNI